MLRNFREGVKGPVGKVLLAIIIVPFVGFGAFDLITNRGGAQAVLAVNGEEIDQEQFYQELNMVRNELASQMGDNADYSQLTEERLWPIVRQRLVQSTLLEQFSTKLDVIVPDVALDQRIVSMPDFQDEGRFSNELLQVTLANSGMTLTSLKKTLERDTRTVQIVSGIAGSGFVSNKAVELMLKVSEEERGIDSVTVSFADQLKGIDVDEETLERYFAENKEQFKTELAVDVSYLLLTANDFRDTVSEEQIAEEYELRQSQFETAESRSISHILLEINEGQTESQATELLQQIKKRIDAGEDFGVLAKEFSQDSGSAAFGGELGSAERDGSFPESFEEAMFALELNQVSEPIMTDAGAHLLKVTAIEKNEFPSLEETRDEIVNQIQLGAATKRYVQVKEELADLAFNADGLEEPANSLGLQLSAFDKLGRSGVNVESGERAPDYLRAPSVSSVLFSDELMSEGLNSELIELDASRSIVVSVAGLHQPRDRELNEVREQVLALSRSLQVREQLTAIKDDAAKAIEGGQSLEDFANTRGLMVVKDQKISRRSPNDLEPAILRELFSARRSSVGNTVHSANASNGDLVLFVVNSIAEFSESAPAELRSALSEQASSLAANRELRAVFSQLEQQAEIVDR